MRKIFTSLCALLMAGTMSMTAQSYELRVLTFEDGSETSGFAAETYNGEVSNWSEMIPAADDQGAPAILYADGSGADYPFYWWHDGGNTELFSQINEGYGTYCYWSGGEAVSNIWTSDYETYNYYTSQFTAYRPGLADNNLNTAGGGHNGSDNFCVHFGYIDDQGWGLATVDAITFADGIARVIDHVWVNPTTYTYYCITSGNELSDALGEDGKIWIEARGFASAEDSEPSATEKFLFFDGQGTATLDWTKWDLSGLGAIEKLEFTMYGEGLGSDNGYGLSQPAYFAWDDMAVRFPVATPDPEPEPTSYTRSGLTNGKFGTICLPYDVAEGNFTGATFYKVAERTTEYVTLEEVTSLTAGVAYIFEATGTEINCTYTPGTKVDAPVTATTANVLQGVFELTTIPTGSWFLNGNQWWCSTGSQTAAANRAYLTNLTPTNVAPVPGRRRVNMPVQAKVPTAVDHIQGYKDHGMKVLRNGQLYIIKNGVKYNAQGQIVK